MAGLYGARLPWELEPHYSRHVAALTDERLESKAAIAAELAYRDAQLVEARAEAERLRALVGRQHEALSAWAAPGGVCAMCPGEDGEHSSRCILGDKDGHRAAEEWAALRAVGAWDEP